jgi:hypothetical protein
MTKITIQEELQSGARIMALSWKEPYASMMLHGKIETRTWKTDYRGLVLICTSKKKYNSDVVQAISGYIRSKEIAQTLFGRDSLALVYDSSYNLGCAIAVGRLIACKPMEWEDEAKAFVTCREALWCHFYEDVVAIEPISFKGGQKWTKVSQDIINKIKFR